MTPFRNRRSSRSSSCARTLSGRARLPPPTTIGHKNRWHSSTSPAPIAWPASSAPPTVMSAPEDCLSRRTASRSNSRTVTGVLIAQRRSDRREREAWQRERDRERQLWAREDALRNFEQRRDTYVSFYETLRKTVLKVYDHGMGLSAPPPEEDEGELPFEWNQEIA